MTVDELNELIARGAAQPGISELQEMMRLGRMFDEQAREFAGINAVSFTTTATSTGADSVMPPVAVHANVG
jgi:hypothetical protein